MLGLGIGLSVFAIAIVLVDAAILEAQRQFPLWPAPAALVLAFGLLIGPAAFKNRLLDDALLRERWCCAAMFAAFLALYGVSSFSETPYNEQLRQAVAFLHGHTFIEAPDSYLESAHVGSYRYALHPPLAAILLMPPAAIWGMSTNQNMWSLLIGALDAALAWRLLGRFRMTLSARMWLTIFFGAGTILWSETIFGNTWSMPETCSIIFTLLALDEAFGEARPLALGVYAGLAALARYELALAGVAYAILALRRRRRFGDLIWMLPGFIAVGLVFVCFNEARYGSFFDQGITLTGPRGAPAFGLRYLLGNLNTIFLMGPDLDEKFPYLHPNLGGLSLIYTSPALILALRANFAKLEAAVILATAFVVSVPSLLCYANGFAQYGTRHYLQVFPFLLVLMAMGTRRADQLMKIMVAASVILITFGVIHIRIWGLD